jgi:hypothetical protein
MTWDTLMLACHWVRVMPLTITRLNVLVSPCNDANRHADNADSVPIAMEPPEATGEETVSETIEVSGTFDGEGKVYRGVGDGGQDEGQDPLFRIADGGAHAAMSCP